MYEAVLEYMPLRHMEAFRLAAARFQVWILVRRGNKSSKRWIGVPGYIPKMLDCKAKTAQIDVNGDGSTAGLVVSPVLLPGAFKREKLASALKEWAGFEPKLYVFDSKTALADDRAGKHYTLQSDPKHKHFGCVMYKPVFRGQCEYIHGDYDLYAIVPAADPQVNVRVAETGFGGEAHSRGPLLYDVQYFFKAAGMFKGSDSGIPMIRHGEQETFKTDWEDTLDVFWPDGKTVTELSGGAQIQGFYRDTLQGRRPYGKDDQPGQPGHWQRR
ncbi:MAG: hypothetical protein U0Q16_00525 [Bryobacteraceae bacterium]